MIRGDQLMLGDYVLVSGTPRKVEMITKKKIGYHINPQTDNRLYYARLRNVEPIEITEALLQATGFKGGTSYLHLHEFDVDEHHKIWYYLEDKAVAVFWYGKDKEYKNGNRWERNMHLRLRRDNASSLHQLQQVCRICGIEIDWKL